MTSLVATFVQHKDLVYNDIKQKKEQMLTFVKLEPDQVWHCFFNLDNDYTRWIDSLRWIDYACMVT